MSDKEPYLVKVDDQVCKYCGHGKTWTVVGPDGYAIGTSYSDEEEAGYIAELLNGAYQSGMEAGQ